MKLDSKLQEKLGELFASPIGENELPGALLVDIEKIQTAAQPRQNFDEVALKNLENSIRELHHAGKGIGGTGILQPLLVRSSLENRNGGKEYIVTAGERRFRAAKAAGLKQIPVILNESSADEAWEHAIIENLLRADLGPLEEAGALQKLMQSRGYSVREAAKRLGKDKGYLENRLFLLKAPQDVQTMVSARADTMRHAREISKIKEISLRRKLIEQSLEGASFATIQRRVQQLLEPIFALKPDSPAKSGGQDSRENSRNSAALSACADSKKISDKVLNNKGLVALENALKKVEREVQNLPTDGKSRLEFAGELQGYIVEIQNLIARIEKASA